MFKEMKIMFIVQVIVGLVIRFVMFTGISCGIAWLVGKIFELSINYWIPFGVAVLLTLIATVITILQLSVLNRAGDAFDKHWDRWD